MAEGGGGYAYLDCEEFSWKLVDTKLLYLSSFTPQHVPLVTWSCCVTSQCWSSGSPCHFARAEQSLGGWLHTKIYLDLKKYLSLHTVYSGGSLVRAQGVGGEAGVGARVLGAEPEYM